MTTTDDRLLVDYREVVDAMNSSKTSMSALVVLRRLRPELDPLAASELLVSIRAASIRAGRDHRAVEAERRLADRPDRTEPLRSASAPMSQRRVRELADADQLRPLVGSSALDLVDALAPTKDVSEAISAATGWPYRASRAAAHILRREATEAVERAA